MRKQTIPRSDTDEKLEELILYIAKRAEPDPAFGATKLNKILFFADFESYAQCGESITGQEYMKLEHGPVPRRLKPVMDRLTAQKRIAIEARNYKGKEQKRAVARSEPRLTMFSEVELSLVDHFIDELWGDSASKVSDLSHQFVGWKVARLKETIPYETMLISARPLTEADLEHARRLDQQWKAESSEA